MPSRLTESGRRLSSGVLAGPDGTTAGQGYGCKVLKVTLVSGRGRSSTPHRGASSRSRRAPPTPPSRRASTGPSGATTWAPRPVRVRRRAGRHGRRDDRKAGRWQQHAALRVTRAAADRAHGGRHVHLLLRPRRQLAAPVRGAADEGRARGAWRPGAAGHAVRRVGGPARPVRPRPRPRRRAGHRAGLGAGPAAPDRGEAPSSHTPAEPLAGARRTTVARTAGTWAPSGVLRFP